MDEFGDHTMHGYAKTKNGFEIIVWLCITVDGVLIKLGMSIEAVDA